MTTYIFTGKPFVGILGNQTQKPFHRDTETWIEWICANAILEYWCNTSLKTKNSLTTTKMANPFDTLATYAPASKAKSWVYNHHNIWQHLTNRPRTMKLQLQAQPNGYPKSTPEYLQFTQNNILQTPTKHVHFLELRTRLHTLHTLHGKCPKEVIHKFYQFKNPSLNI